MASELFAEVHRGKKVRLLGIYASHFGAASLSSGSSRSRRRPRRSTSVRDEVQKRFGERRSRGRASSAAASAATPPTSRRARRLARPPGGPMFAQTYEGAHANLDACLVHVLAP